MTVFDPAIVEAAAQFACDDIYDPVTPGVFAKLYRVGESVCGTLLLGGVFYVVMQGTEIEEMAGDGQLHFSLQGWAADFDCAPFEHPELGAVHGGFYRNLSALLALLLPDIPHCARVIVTGHSKGAAEAALLGALLKLAGIGVAGLVLFACPHPGTREFAVWVQANLPGMSYRNAPRGMPLCGDPVPLVPLWPYVAAYPVTVIECAPVGLERAMSVAWHRGALYLRGVHSSTAARQ